MFVSTICQKKKLKRKNSQIYSHFILYTDGWYSPVLPWMDIFFYSIITRRNKYNFVIYEFKTLILVFRMETIPISLPINKGHF